jgi:hypothetical protein
MEPNGKESWERNTSHAITWSYTGNPGNSVKIVVLKGSAPVGIIAENTPIGNGGKGSYTWTIYPTGSTGSDYKVSVQSVSQIAIMDTSDDYFTISSAITSEQPMIGVYKDGTWYLDWNGNGAWDSGVDKICFLGAFGWMPFIGNWKATGNSCIGVTNGQQWYLDGNGDGTWESGVDETYSFGAFGWTPVLGDWNGDGKTEIGVYQNGAWYLDFDGSGSWTAGDKTFNFGATGWKPVVKKQS